MFSIYMIKHFIKNCNTLNKILSILIDINLIFRIKYFIYIKLLVH
jgi:hypothetical protein